MGDCLSCGYFEKFFGSHSTSTERKRTSDGKSVEAATEKKNFLGNFIHDIAQGGDGIKDRAAGLRENSSAIAVHKTNMKKSLPVRKFLT